MHNLILFASGRGSNVQAIVDYFRDNEHVNVALIVTNKADAGVLDIANTERIPFLIVDRQTIKGTLLIEQLQDYNPSLIVLAGFLWKIPQTILEAFPDKIINIHPALLPKHGGKGMWGHHVHSAVLEAADVQSGITIHKVNEHYDEGNVLLQAYCDVEKGDTADSLAARVLKLEHYYYPRTIEFLLRDGDRRQ